MRRLARVAMTAAIGIGMAVAPITLAGSAHAEPADYLVVQEGCTEFNAIVPVGKPVLMPLPDDCSFDSFDDGGAFTGGSGVDYDIAYDAGLNAILVTLHSGADGFVFANLDGPDDTFDGPYFIPCGSYGGSFPGEWTHISYCPQVFDQARPIWLQSIGRASAEAACPEGYGASWAEWPFGGRGGYVCDRQVFADVPVS